MELLLLFSITSLWFQKDTDFSMEPWRYNDKQDITMNITDVEFCL